LLCKGPMHFINLLRQNHNEIVILTQRIQCLLIDITLLTLLTRTAVP
jgi:hypothetical protein